MNRRPGADIVANPVLVGAVTSLVVVVAVFLAYNANNGLPFVPTRTLLVESPNGAEVQKGVEVREGGYRIGIVEDAFPRRLPNGQVAAILRLKLDQKSGEVPKDSIVTIRPRSALALKIVEIQRGRSREIVPDGGRLPVTQTRINTDLDELFTVYDKPTRQGTRDNLLGFGNAFVGRGATLNETITLLPQFFGFLEPVMRNLAAPRTELPTFFKELGDAARVAAPVSRQLARGFGFQADTYAALVRFPEEFKATISDSPETLDASRESFIDTRPFLRETAAFSRDLDAVATDLRFALPVVNDALRIGTPITRRSVLLNQRLQRSFTALRDLAAAPGTNGAIRGLTATVTTLQPQLKFLGPYITVCNYWNIFWTFASEHFSTPDPSGSAQRVLLNTGDRQNDNASSNLGANEYATGRNVSSPSPDAIRQYIHGNTNGGKAVTSDGRANCVPGQQGYTFAANANDDTANNFYGRAVVDQLNGQLEPEAPVLGPTYDFFDKNGRGVGVGRPRVPKGQTFTDLPGGRAALTEYDRAQYRRRGAKP